MGCVFLILSRWLLDCISVVNVGIPNGHGHDQPDSIGLGCGHAPHMVMHSGRDFDA
jgi:hypothetical protein